MCIKCSLCQRLSRAPSISSFDSAKRLLNDARLPTSSVYTRKQPGKRTQTSCWRKHTCLRVPAAAPLHPSPAALKPHFHPTTPRAMAECSWTRHSHSSEMQDTSDGHLAREHLLAWPRLSGKWAAVQGSSNSTLFLLCLRSQMPDAHRAPKPFPTCSCSPLAMDRVVSCIPQIHMLKL